jgi:hypothetical protein
LVRISANKAATKPYGMAQAKFSLAATGGFVMIKSFLKKVFSSSPEPMNDERREQKEPQSKGFLESLAEERLNSVKQEYVEITITRDWLERHNVKEFAEIIAQLYEEVLQAAQPYPKRVKLKLAEFFHHEMDTFLAKRLSKYLDQCEQDIIDLTFFLDKDDPLTADIYRTYLLPQQIEGVHSFIRERCMMIYETCIGLSLDYRKEIDTYFQFLGVNMGETFFEEFELWKDKVLKLHQDQLDEQTYRLTSSVFENTMLTISRQEVESEDTEKIEHFINDALLTPEAARLRKGKLLFSFHGFSEEEDLVELMNRKEINAWASIVVEKYPYIFYFLNDEEYPMTKFLTSLVVSTEVENDAVYFNVEELNDFRDYVQDAIVKLSEWLKEDPNQNALSFQRQFG